MSVPLTVLDLVPITSGSTASQALANSVDLCRRAEELGYARYWVAEHHLNPGVAGTAPAVVLALLGAATSSIRIGSGAVLMGHRTPLSVVEEFGLLDAAYPGRVDLGLGRSGRPPADAGAPSAVPLSSNGLVVPPKHDPGDLFRSPRFALQRHLLSQPGAEAPPYADQVDDVLALLNGTYRADDGTEAHVVPGEGAELELWVLGSSGGESASVAGARSLPFAANYHVSPGTVLEAVAGYRAAFRPSASRTEAHVAVSADVVVAPTASSAASLAAGYAPWVHSIRSAAGAIPYPSPAEAAELPWGAVDSALVADRVDTQFVGTAEVVADRLEELREATGADELVVTTITHEHGDRVRSLELLASEWSRRGLL